MHWRRASSGGARGTNPFRRVVIYREGAPLDFTFGVLVSGDLIVEKGGSILGGIFERQIFGEMAYFTNERMRTATVRVGSPPGCCAQI